MVTPMNPGHYPPGQKPPLFLQKPDPFVQQAIFDVTTGPYTRKTEYICLYMKRGNVGMIAYISTKYSCSASQTM